MYRGLLNDSFKGIIHIQVEFSGSAGQMGRSVTPNQQEHTHSSMEREMRIMN
jgi:hypothetical protein